MSEEFIKRLKRMRAQADGLTPIELSGPEEMGRRLGLTGNANASVEVHVLAAEAEEPDAMTIEEALRRYGRADGKLHVKDTFVFLPNGGREHVLEIPPGAKYVQVVHSLRY